PNTESNSQYIQRCKAVGIPAHPARFPQKLPAFFINFLTEPNDTVLDIFAGSNTTGAAAESSGRKWIAFEKNQEYLAASAFRFLDNRYSHQEIETIFQSLLKGEGTVNIHKS
ncbi:MAG TPA: site-specific DNA-methyltransferase, partial [Cyanophyceae cyanobacterium]